MRDFVTYAYDVRYDHLMGAPDWAASEHYDLEAKSSGETKLTQDQARQMMQTLLEQRFQLKVQRQTQEEAVYLLKVAKGGSKMKQVAADATGGMVVRGTDKGVLQVEAGKATMDRLATQLSFTSSRRVLDQTGLAGFFAFTFDYFPDNRQMPADLDAPTMFEALRPLGLQIEQGKAPIERLYIDRVERPAEN